MTLTELKNEVTALSFDPGITLGKSFVIYANRALRRIYTDRGYTKTVKLPIFSRLPRRRLLNVTHIGGSSDTFGISGRAYCIEVSGEGVLTVKEGDIEQVFEFNSDHTVFKGFFNKNAKLIFSGEHSYLINRIAIFDKSFGSDLDSIPDADERFTVNLGAILPDFVCITKQPTDSDGAPIELAIIEDGRITLPTEFSGDIFITYMRAPQPMSESSPDARIDLSEDAAHLLPLLVTSYVCLECDPERAAYYEGLYRDEIATVNKSRRRMSSPYIDVNGWA